MRESLEKVPTWAVFLLTGVPFGLAVGIYSKVDGGSTGFALVFGVLFGLLVGLTLSISLRRYRMFQVQAFKGAPLSLRRAAGRALRNGPVPADPEVRTAAIQLAEHQLDLLLRWRIASLIIWVLLLVVSIVSVFDGSPWRLVLVALYLFLIVYQLRRPGRLRARIEQLKSAQSLEEHGS